MKAQTKTPLFIVGIVALVAAVMMSSQHVQTVGSATQSSSGFDSPQAGLPHEPFQPIGPGQICDYGPQGPAEYECPNDMECRGDCCPTIPGDIGSYDCCCLDPHGDRCSRDDQCASGFCAGGVCGCTDNSQCGSFFCRDGKCSDYFPSPKPHGEPCYQDVECGFNERCCARDYGTIGFCASYSECQDLE